MGKFFKGLAITGAAIGLAAVAGAAYGLYKWSKDEDSEDIKLVFGGPNGIRISKDEETGKFTVDTRYDWQNDPEFCDDEECECCCEDEADECCCEEEPCECGEEAADDAEADSCCCEAEEPKEAEDPQE